MISAFLLCILIHITNIQAATHKINLGLNATLNWTIDYKIKELNIEVHTKWCESQNEWFAVGFSDYGEMKPSDLCIFWVNWKEQGRLQDTFVDEKGVISIDSYQDCNNFRFRKSDHHLVFFFTRKFDTCDTNDYVIELGVPWTGNNQIYTRYLNGSQSRPDPEVENHRIENDGTTHVVWAKGKGPLYRLDKMNINSAYATGFERTTLLAYDATIPKHPKDTFTLEIKAIQNKVPNQKTLYYCKVIMLPKRFQEKHHIIQYEPTFDPKTGHFLHHMEVFHCLAPRGEEIPSYEGSCFDAKRPARTKVCSQVMAAWAMGAKPFNFPQEAGWPIGGPNFNQYVMLELHYHNPNLVDGIVDSSGMRLYITKSLRRFDSGIMELGLEYNDKMAIPPGEREFKLTGHCIEACTAVGIPKTGITVFASQLHTHLTGVKVYTKHIRHGLELPELNRDNHYSQHFQEIRRLKRKVKILPGDALVTTCEYNTNDRENVTLTGFSITDEMCVNYIQYYPRAELEVCKSSIPDSQLHNYFKAMFKWEKQMTSKAKGISENYQSIEWTPIRNLYLQHLYDTSPISMQCNQSSGTRFPGYWEDMPNTKIVLPLLVKNYDCKNVGY